MNGVYTGSPAPTFPIGFEVLIDRHFGPMRPDSVQNSYRYWCKVKEIRLAWKVDVNEEGEEIDTWPKGWEYRVFTAGGSEWGWLTEMQIIEQGYTLTPPTGPKRQCWRSDQADLHQAILNTQGDAAKG